MVAPTIKRERGIICLQIDLDFRKFKDTEVTPNKYRGNAISLIIESLAINRRSSLMRGIPPKIMKPIIIKNTEDNIINMETLVVKEDVRRKCIDITPPKEITSCIKGFNL